MRIQCQVAEVAEEMEQLKFFCSIHHVRKMKARRLGDSLRSTGDCSVFGNSSSRAEENTFKISIPFKNHIYLVNRKHKHREFMYF